jgi:preprotein translocase subunit YajC
MIIGASSSSGFFLIIIVGFAVLYLLVVRPQKRRQVQQRQMLNELQVGDEVLTAGGIYGKITRLEEDAVLVEIAPRMEVRVARRAIAGVTRDEPDEPEEPEEPEEPAQEPASVDAAEQPEGVISTEENRG